MAKNNIIPDEADRIRANTSEEYNARIDRFTENNTRFYATQSKEMITERIDELEEEWDVDRLVQLSVSGVGVTSMLLGVLGSKKWWLVTTAALGFLGNHAVSGWCPSAALFRRLGFRTRQEIDSEKYALKALRGDFDELSNFENGKIDEKIQSAIEAVRSL